MRKYHPCTDSVIKKKPSQVQEEECDPEVYGEKRGEEATKHY